MPAPPGQPDRTPVSRRGRWPQGSDVAESCGPVVHALFRLSRKNRAMAADLLRPLGLFPGQELLLLQMPEGECRSQHDLVDALGLDHSTVTKMVQRLERAGVLTREPSGRDRRVMMVRLTDQGIEQRRAVAEMWSRMEQATTADLSDRQRTQLLGLLRRIEAGLDAGGGDCC